MDLFRKFLGLPRREEQIPFTPRSQIPSEGLFVPESQFEDEDGIFPEHGLNSQLDQEIQEMERQFRDLWSMFGMGPGLFNEGFKNLFEDFGAISPGISPGENVPALPAPRATEEDDNSLRHKMLKPSLAPPPKSHEDRRDQDLDNRVQEGGLSALLEDGDAPIAPPPSARSPTFKSFSRSVSIQTYRRPDGVMETKKVVCDSEGNEEVTITEHPPDGSMSSHPGPHSGILGRFPMNPGFFGPPTQDHPGPSQDHSGFFGQTDHRDLNLFNKLFGPRF